MTLPTRRLDGRPLGAGPLEDVVVDLETQRNEYFKAADWDPKTSVPSEAALTALGLEDLVADLHGS